MHTKKAVPFVALAALSFTTSLIGAAISPALAASDPPKDAAAAAPQADFRQGALYGRVLDTNTGQPIAGAVVALQNKKGETVAWSRTDAQGYYTVAAETIKVLQLEPSRRRGLLERMARGVGTVVMAPVKVVGGAAKMATDVVKQVDPIGTAKAAVITTVTGNPAPVAGQIVGNVKDAIEHNAEQKAEAAQKALADGKTTARVATAKTVMGERQAAPPKDKREKLLPGEVFIAVSASGYSEIKGKAGAYWLEPPRYEEGKKDPTTGARAWLETVKLAPPGNKKAGEIENLAILLSDPRVNETLVPSGGVVNLTVKVKTPEDKPLNLRVFAREAHRGVTAELLAQGNGVYGGTLTLDPKTSPGETTISVVALRAEPVEVTVKKSDKGDPLLLFCRELEELEANKPFAFDPRIFAAENRLDISLTVLDPKLSTTASPAVAPTAPATPPPATPPPATPPPATPPPATPPPATPPKP